MSLSMAINANSVVVLVVEDDIFVRYDIAACLRDAGYVVVEAASGEEAIALCKSTITIDIVFTDINLDGPSDGWDVGKRFGAERPNVPVLYTSGQCIGARSCGPRSLFVAKPYRQADILAACQRLCGTSTF
jgi:CheY-like chemotaxis protein